MRRIVTVALVAALLTTTAWAGPRCAAGSAGTAGSDPAGGRQRPARRPTSAPWSVASGPSSRPVWRRQLARARLATGKYATNLRAAKADGYQIITRMIPDMGWHFLNPAIQGFDVTKPAILVYERHGRSWQLGALEWVFPETPATPPLPGATYGSFARPATTRTAPSCSPASRSCAPRAAPQTGARFNFWHPDLVTLHVWLWYHNPDGLYSGTNPLVRPFNRG